MIDGTTLVADGPPIAISGTTLSLASGNSGLYLTGVGTASTAVSMPVTAGELMTMNAAGKPVEAGSSDSLEGGGGGGGLGSLIMLGMGQGGVTSASSGGGGASHSNVMSTADLVAFRGAANKNVGSYVLVSFSLVLCVGVLAV